LELEGRKACNFNLAIPSNRGSCLRGRIGVNDAPKERRDGGQADLLRSRLDAITDINHALMKLARTIDWSFLEERFGTAYEDKPGRRYRRRGG